MPESDPKKSRSLDSPSLSPIPPKLFRSEDENEAPEPMSSIGVKRYLISVEYVGTKFFGSQKQPDRRTVVGVLEEAFEKFLGKSVAVYCSSRTDAGVHALSNVCHVDLERTSKRKPGEILPPFEPDVVRRAVNHFLQKNAGDMIIVDVQCVPPNFHARYKAKERTYFYRILCGPEPVSVFERERAWHVPEDLDISAMQEACDILVGHHDFSSFRASGCQAKSPVRTLDELQISEVTPSPHFPSLADRGHLNTIDLQFGQRRGYRCFVVTARACSFLYHQVRLLVGVLKAVGTKNLAPNDVKRILEAKTVTACTPMAPACGLYLENVKYDLL